MLWDRAARVAGGLRALGIQRGDRVAIRLGNGADWVLAFLGGVLPDGTGELLVRGPNVVSGYWNKPEATAAAFAGGWLYTGDLARIDDEGLVYLVDRRKDMINRGGENVYCVEVENALAGAPGVDEAAVLGVPDEMMGEKVGAVVVAAPGIWP